MQRSDPAAAGVMEKMEEWDREALKEEKERTEAAERRANRER